jgi:hypothetical protein
MNLGLLIILISLLGGISNWLNWRYLNYSIVRLLYYLGAVVHELSHAFLCILTGAKITEISIFSKQPHIAHSKSTVPFLGELLISLAPIIGGLFFLFLINKYWLESYFILPPLYNWQSILTAPLKIFAQINFLSWKSWIMIFLSLNIGAMIGPSWQDLKNVWPIIIILFFFNDPFLAHFDFLAVTLILSNIFIQLCFILIIQILSRLKNSYFRNRI